MNHEPDQQPTTRPTVRQMRLVVAVDDFEAAIEFYRDELRMPQLESFQGDDGALVAILDAGAATLELSNPAQVRLIDRVEAEGQPSAHLRVAFEVADTVGTTRRLAAAGAHLTAEPRVTPWQSLNSRMDAPGGVQLTLFQELDSGADGSAQPGFTE
jgi:catechol 2,3-dioxygenase-like lactoylglutathione lyase family enzyme